MFVRGRCELCRRTRPVGVSTRDRVMEQGVGVTRRNDRGLAVIRRRGALSLLGRDLHHLIVGWARDRPGHGNV